MKVKEEHDKVGLKLNIQKTKIMASGPITSWQIDGKTVADYVFMVQNHCRRWLSHEIKRQLLLGRNVMSNLESIVKSRDITLSTMVHLVKSIVFPVVMHGCESWTVKKAEHWRIDAFELWCWRRFLSTLDCKEIQLVHPKADRFLGVHWKDWCWNWNSSTLTTWCKVLTHWKRPWCWERLRAGGEGDDRGWDCWMASPTQWTWVWVNSCLVGVGDGQGGLACWSPWGRKESDTTEWPNWT